jgi:hypothetical protein
MRVLDHAEAVITDDDVDGNWQLKDIPPPSAPSCPRSPSSTSS